MREDWTGNQFTSRPPESRGTRRSTPHWAPRLSWQVPSFGKPGGLRAQAILAVAIAMLLMVTSCTQRPVSFQAFTYPPSSNPTKTDWRYTMEVDVLWDGGSFASKSEKDVRIKVWDRSFHDLLDDRLSLTAASVDATATWSEPGRVEVRFLETGDPDSARNGDSYNRALIASGPRTLANLAYRRNPSNGRFERVK